MSLYAQTNITDPDSIKASKPKTSTSLTLSAIQPASIGNTIRANDPADPNQPRIVPWGPDLSSLENSPTNTVCPMGYPMPYINATDRKNCFSDTYWKGSTMTRHDNDITAMPNIIKFVSLKCFVNQLNERSANTPINPNIENINPTVEPLKLKCPIANPDPTASNTPIVPYNTYMECKDFSHYLKVLL